MRRKPLEIIPLAQRRTPDEEDVLQTEGAGGAAPEITPSTESGIDALRVHHDAGANELAWSVSARAFTLGRDIVFGAGEYSQGAFSGEREGTASRASENPVLRKENTIYRQTSACGRAKGGAIAFILTSSGIDRGFTPLKQRVRVDFSNSDNKPHRIEIRPTGLFTQNSVIVPPNQNAAVSIRALPTTVEKIGHIVDDVPAATSGSFHDIIICP